MKSIIKKLFLNVFFLISINEVTAQLNPSPSQFFHNQIVQTVAGTGLRDLTQLDMSFRNILINSFYGAPVNMYATLQTQLKNGSGMGLVLSADKAGFLSRSRIMGSYALDLSRGVTRFRLGIGLGVMMSRFNNKNGTMIRGDVNDPALADFNQQRPMVDGSVGFLLENENGFQVLANIPSIGSIQQFSKYSSINYTVFNTMIKRRFILGVNSDEYIDGFSSFEPMFGFRMIHGGEDVFDMGILYKHQDWIGFTAMYHSNNEYSIGVHIPYKERLALNFTFNSGKVYSRDYLNVVGTLEGHIAFNLGKY